MSKLSFGVKNFQAIGEADIQLEGITVLAGDNSTGKSTLSKLLYLIIKTALEYDKNEWRRLMSFQHYIIQRLIRLMDEYDIDSNKEFRQIWDDNFSSDVADIGENTLLFKDLIKEIEILFTDHESKNLNIDYRRFSLALSLAFSQKNRVQFETIDEIFLEIENQHDILKKSVNDNLSKRPLEALNSQIESDFKVQPQALFLNEENTPIVDLKNDRLNNVFSIDKVFYNDTPISISLNRREIGPRSSFNTFHWEHLRQAIINSPDAMLSTEQKEVNSIISKIIGGKATLEDKKFTKSFSYTRSSDNQSFDLADSATGIMSFAIIQLLLSKGLLDANTLLILDEPEAHLHPQWIVEYARVMVLLNKKLGVKFMLASHSPDMISAIRYISEKEGNLEDVSFYLSQRMGESEQYSYRNLGQDIEPIFESFNIALDRISDYGV